jgi:hypothetical protein
MCLGQSTLLDSTFPDVIWGENNTSPPPQTQNSSITETQANIAIQPYRPKKTKTFAQTMQVKKMTMS